MSRLVAQGGLHTVPGGFHSCLYGSKIPVNSDENKFPFREEGYPMFEPVCWSYLTLNHWPPEIGAYNVLIAACLNFERFCTDAAARFGSEPSQNSNVNNSNPCLWDELNQPQNEVLNKQFIFLLGFHDRVLAVGLGQHSRDGFFEERLEAAPTIAQKFKCWTSELTRALLPRTF